MTDRIHQYLEGEITRDDLTGNELPDAEAVARLVREARTFVRARPAPDFAPLVLSRIQAPVLRGPRDPFERLAAAFWAPRHIRFRPAYLLAAVAMVAALLVGRLALPRTATGEPQFFVQFHLHTNASSVQLAGSFTGWQPDYQLHESTPGVWTITLPLSPGVHDYAFLVNGADWVPDPFARQVDDGFGGVNSRIALLPPEGGRSL